MFNVFYPPARNFSTWNIGFIKHISYCRIVLRIPTILKRKTSGAKSCSTLTPVSSTFTTCKSKKSPEFVWIGYHHNQQGNNPPADNHLSRVSTRSSNKKNLQQSFKKKTAKRKLIFKNTTTPISALKVKCHLANLNRNISNIETPPDFKIYDELPQTLQFLNAKTPTLTNGRKCTILSTPLPPIPARKPRILFAVNQPLNQNRYFMHSYDDLLAFNAPQPTLYWENNFINTNTLII